MGKSSPSPPAAPDPAATAAAQGKINRETAIAQARLNQVDDYTPYGSSIYEPTGETRDDIDQYKRTTTLDPAQQAIFEQQTGITQDLNLLADDQLGRVSSNLADPFSFEGLPAAPVANEAARQQAIDAIYGQHTSRLDPRFARDKTALETRLANQGIPVGSDAFSEAMESQGRTRNDAYTSALNQAIASGGAEQSRLFGLGGSERARAIQEYTTQRNAPLNEVAALMSGNSITNPQFSSMPNTAINPPDLIGLTRDKYATDMSAYNQQLSSNSSTQGGLFGLAGNVAGGLPYESWFGAGAGAAGAGAGAAGAGMSTSTIASMAPYAAGMGFSSRKFKKLHGEAPTVLDKLADLPIYSWEYTEPSLVDGQMHMGPTAEDFRDTFGVGDGISIHLIDVMGVGLAAMSEMAQRMTKLESNAVIAR